MFTKSFTEHHSNHHSSDKETIIKKKIFIYICWVQKMDLHNPWIAQRKPWIHTLRDNPWIACAKYKFADNPWIALRAQTTDCLVCSQVQSKDKLQVSGVVLAS